MKDLIVGYIVDQSTKDKIIGIIKNFWYFFCKESVQHTVIGYEFTTYTGNKNPVFCKTLLYRLYEFNIILHKILQLLSNVCISKYAGPWRRMIILTSKPHQDPVDKVLCFICITQKKPIPQWDDTIDIIDSGSNEIWRIIIGALQGYHQVAEKESYKEKLALFSPNDKKYCVDII